MPDGMDGTRREALREALRRRECERGGEGPDFETVRRRVVASPSPLDRRGGSRRVRTASSSKCITIRAARCVTESRVCARTNSLR